MTNKESAIDRIEELSNELRQSRTDAGELLDSYQSLVDDVASALDGTDAALAELKTLADMIEVGEVEVNEDTERALQYLYDARRDVANDTRVLKALRDGTDGASKALFDFTSTQSYVVILSRRVQ